MSYIYDIVVNLSNSIIDCFEWNKSDNIVHLRKIPVIRVDSNTLYDLAYNRIKVDMEIFSAIKSRGELYNKNEIIFTDTKTNICVRFKDGINIQKSYLQFDVDEEIEEFSNKLNLIKIDYQLLDVTNLKSFKTRRELLVENYVIKNLKILEKNNDIEKLKYIYYDCFNEKEENKDLIMKKIIDNINDIDKKIYNFLKLTSINK